MNDLDLDRLGARASAAVREEADRIADSNVALAALLASELSPADDGDARSNLVVLESAERRTAWRRSPYLAWAAAVAAVAIAAAAIAVVVDEDDSISTVDLPTVPTAPTSTPSTIPSSTTVSVPSTAPTTETTTPPTRLPGTTTITDTAFGDALDRVVLASFADGELGFEQCQECEPMRPWAALDITLAASTSAPTSADIDPIVLVADAFNRRWVRAQGDIITIIPFGDAVVVGSPVLGPDRLVYALVGATFNQLDPRRVVAYEPLGMSEVASFDVSERIANRLEIWNGQLLLGDEVVTTFDLPLGTPTIDIQFSNPTVDPVIEHTTITISGSGVQHSFVLPDDWSLNGRESVTLDDGSVLVRVIQLSDGEQPMPTALLRLWADGTYSTHLVTDTNRNPTIGLDVQLTTSGLVQLERVQGGPTEVAAYLVDGIGGLGVDDRRSTPTTGPTTDRPGQDPLAGWQFPELSPVQVDDVPYLLPDPMPPSTSALRFESGDQPASPSSAEHAQLWVRAVPDGTVDAVFIVNTRLGSPAPWSGAFPIEVSGWPQALAVDGAPGTVLLELSSALGTVEIRSHGLTQEEVLAIVEAMRVSPAAVGWTSPTLDSWTEFPTTSTSGYAGRTVVTYGPDGQPEYSFGVTRGQPLAEAGPGVFVGDGLELSLTQVGGQPALIERGEYRQSIVWVTPDGAVVTIGTTAGEAALMGAVATLREVDRTTWEAVAEPPSPADDGCLGLFC